MKVPLHALDRANRRTKTAWQRDPATNQRTKAEHFKRCPLCGGYVDMRDRVWLEEHQQPLPHPACDRTQ
jgi:hypothetical protein